MNGYKLSRLWARLPVSEIWCKVRNKYVNGFCGHEDCTVYVKLQRYNLVRYNGKGEQVLKYD